MSDLPVIGTTASTGLAAGGAVLLLGATLWAAWPRGRAADAEESAPGVAAARSFAWIVIAGMGYSLLALAAAVRVPEAEGLRAAIFQLLAVLLAAGLGSVGMSGKADDEGGRSPLGSVAVFGAWISLVGLPPTVGFHGKVLVYRALLSVGWEWLMVVAAAGTVVALVPAFWALSTYRTGTLRGVRAVLAVALSLAVVLLGIYPQAGLLMAGPVVGLAVGK